MKIRPNSILVMSGDSITECGRGTPIREANLDSLGHGYVYFVHCLIAAADPALHVRVLNMGVSGNTVRDLAGRWEKDVLDRAPDWLSVMIGINDVWRHYDSRDRIENLVSLEEFASTLERLVAGILPRLKGLVLMAPYYVEPDRADPMRAMMDRYGGEVRRLARKYQTGFVDTQAVIDLAMGQYPPAELAADRVHVNPVGHMILARAFLKAVDYSW